MLAKSRQKEFTGSARILSIEFFREITAMASTHGILAQFTVNGRIGAGDSAVALRKLLEDTRSRKAGSFHKQQSPMDPIP